MTERTKEIFEKHEIRKTKEQKSAFREFVTGYAKDEGYSTKIERAGKADNIIVGNPDNAKVIYTAHYDTPPGVPFPNLITPKCIPLYILYQIFIIALLYTVPILLMTLVPHIIIKNGGNESWKVILFIVGYAIMLFELYLLIAGPANKHNANDNTSGISVLLELMHAMPEEIRDNVAFIFFDLEERGTLGSACYKKKHKAAVQNTPIINFDCVGDGDHILLAARKNASVLEEKLVRAYTSTATITSEVVTKGVYYPSDQKNFDLGVGVGAFTMSKRGILYTDKIHTKRDTVCKEENIDYLVEKSINLAQII